MKGFGTVKRKREAAPEDVGLCARRMFRGNLEAAALRAPVDKAPCCSRPDLFRKNASARNHAGAWLHDPIDRSKMKESVHESSKCRSGSQPRYLALSGNRREARRAFPRGMPSNIFFRRSEDLRQPRREFRPDGAGMETLFSLQGGPAQSDRKSK